MAVVKRKHESQSTIDMWTSAFMIFMSLVFEHNVAQAQEMLKYILDIRLDASCSFNWYKYDEQFRICRVSNPSMPWKEIHSEFWLMYMFVSNQSSHNYNSHQSAEASIDQPPKSKSQGFFTNSSQSNVKQSLNCNVYNQYFIP